MVDGLLAVGSEPGWSCHRIEFKLKQPDTPGERSGGGLAESPLIDEFTHLLDTILGSAADAPTLDAPDSPGQWWCWREGNKGELCVDVIFDLQRPIVRYFSGCYLLKGDWAGLKWLKVERPRR